MSQGKDDIKKYTESNAKKKGKRIPNVGRPDGREYGWRDDNNPQNNI